MSPNRGGKGTSGKGRASGAGPAAARRLGLILFGVAFVVLFVIVAIAEGVGDPSIPSGDAILVQDVPGEVGHITPADVEHAIVVTAAGEGQKKAPKPGDPKYEEAKEAAVKFILEGVWIQGLANEWGIEVSDQEVTKKLNEIKKESFKSETEFNEFLKKSHYSQEDVRNRVKIQILSENLQAELKEKAPKPTQGEIKNYYEAAKATQFTQQPSRDVRVVVNKDKAKAEKALAALTKDNSAGNWKKVAKKYSEEAATKESGGLKKGVQEGLEEEPLDAAFFGTPEGQVEGPLKAKSGYTVFEVVNSTPESVQSFETVESQIKATLAQRLEQEYFTNYLSQFAIDWSSRTFCASGYVIERCANYKSSGHPSTAPAGCFEANPKTPPTEGCPAPVNQLVPAVPGTVTPLEPRGKPLAQRPHPPGEEKEEEAAAGLEGLPEGAVPPTEAPPAEGE